MAKYLLEHLDTWDEIIRGNRISLFLDYDGTLTPIADTPEKVRPPYSVRRSLKRLKRYYPVAIISGRSLNDLKKRVGLKGIVYAGNHGLEIWSEDFSLEIKGAVRFKKMLGKIAGRLEDCLRNIEGIIIEDKGLTASVHYRLVDKKDIKDVFEAVKAALSPYLKQKVFVLSKGKKVLEIRPAILWDKGRAVEWTVRQKLFKGRLPIYIGDDRTDQDAFRALKGKGLSVAVGHGLKGADYFLKSQREVWTFLEWLAFARPHKSLHGKG